MDAIALLLNAGETVEAVHQAAWYVLLQKSELLAELGFPSLAQRKVVWEPEAGTFDLKVAGEGRPVWIELKVDAYLGEPQLTKQRPYMKLGSVVYALLGPTAIRARPGTTKKVTDDGAVVITTSDVCAALDRAAEREGIAKGVAHLARAYAEQLRDLGNRGSNFGTADVWNSSHSLSFYDKLRESCEPMKQAVVAYVANPSGGFEACHWGWVPAGDGVRCYLQWEGSGPTPPKLCFKIEVTGSTERSTVRSAAVEFLRKQTLTSATLARPARLGSGQTMTIGIVEDLPVRDEPQWQTVVDAMLEATRVMSDLAEHLRTR
jgi:hypothetical protein